MAVRIHQLLAVVSGLKSDTDAALARLSQVAHNDDLLDGMEKTYRLAAETEDRAKRPTPAQHKKVRYTAVQALADAERLLARQWDTVLTLDAAQATAVADVKVGDVTLMPAVPVRHLVYLEGELSRLQALVAGIPVLDGARDWTDQNVEPGQYKTDARETAKTEKVPYNWHRGNGTANFQEQVDVRTRDEVVEWVTTVDYSGRLPAERKAQLLDRIAELRTAVKLAREEANSATAAPRTEGADIFNWLLAP